MAERKPDNVYLTTNRETGTERLIRAVGSVAARNHAADQLFDVKRLSTGEVLDVMAEKKLAIETAGEAAQTEPSAPEGDEPKGPATKNQDGGSDGKQE